MMYSNHKCYCGAPAVMMSTNLVQSRYYCQRHQWVISKKIEDWLKRQEDKQWGDEPWYRELRPPTPQTLL